MQLFRKKQVIVEAVQFNIDNWKNGKLPDEVVHIRDSKGHEMFAIETLEGRMEVKEGDWVITGTHGEIYPCKPDIFWTIYEKVQSPLWGEEEYEKEMQT